MRVVIAGGGNVGTFIAEEAQVRAEPELGVALRVHRVGERLPHHGDAGLAERSNTVFMGTSVRSGTAKVLIAATGRATVFGGIAGKLALRPALTEFERGIQRFGYLLTRLMLVMVVLVLAINIFMAKPPIASLLFALALAVGLAPELLPAIISITLSHGARRMARRGVIVRRLNAFHQTLGPC